jgi:hypothetical protein
LILIPSIAAFTQDTAGTGMNVNFSIHDIFLAAHTLRMKGEAAPADHKEDIAAFQQYMEEISKEHYDKLMNIEMPGLTPDTLTSDALRPLRAFLLQAIETPQYGKILSQTQNFGMACRNRWQKNFPRAAGIIKDATGFTLDKTFTVYFIHPGFNTSSRLENNVILWGRAGEGENYAAAGMWNEIMHWYMPNDNVARAVTELLCFDHLRAQLGEGNPSPGDNGDPALKEIKEKILPDWREYLGSENKNILVFTVKVRQKLGQ